MTKHAPHIVLAGVDLERRATTSLVEQLYSGLRRAILSGQLRPGTRLPSTRAFATDNNISRNTVVSAFEQLLMEGYLEAKVGAGTCVASSLPDEILTAGNSAEPSVPLSSRSIRLSRRGDVLARERVRLLTVQGTAKPFASGHPDVAAFPIKIWARLTARRWRQRSEGLLTYGDPAGYLPLRQAIASYIRTARAVRCGEEQVIVVSGSQQAIDLITRLLTDPGDSALVEDPGYPGARAALRAAGASLIRLPVDSEGANIQQVREESSRIRLAIVTPSHQYPLGVTMTLPRRLALIQWARQQRAWILEDDYDSDYRYRGRPLPSLQGLDGTGRVIYMGSFSKTIFPSLRLGFVVLPDALVEPFRRARAVVDGHSPTPYQAVLADFISEGHFARHIRRMRTLYEQRQMALVETTRRELAGLLEVDVSEGGMHLVGWLPHGANDAHVSRAVRSCGVYASPLSACAIGNIKRGGLLLGYAGFESSQIRKGVKTLRAALEHALR
ncbi:MAG: PLP-dependent aminotransferase family protein [Acidobacteria bacterium]|jgi:GntR family transcriptional regulator/MocR family aminotransferase|nr:MAG: PLP-dependent aminotransferase family protein [Acidobacteriota bacterium]